MNLLHILMVGIGGFFGAIARFSISKSLNNKFRTKIPLGTLTVNLLGAFLLGILLGSKVDVMVFLLIGTGFMGAFTTFSTLSLELVQMHINKYLKEFTSYIFLTYCMGFILAYLGYWVGGFLNK